MASGEDARRRWSTVSAKPTVGAAFVVQIVGAVEFVLNVGGHGLVEFGLFGGKAVVHSDGVALREEGRTVELEQFFFRQGGA